MNDLRGSGWTPAMRKEYREKTRWSFETVRPLRDVVKDYVEWATTHNVTTIHVYPGGGRNSNSTKVLNMLTVDFPVRCRGIELKEVSDG